MKHDPKTFGRRAPRASTDSAAGWQLRAILKRRREARQAATIAGAAALAFAVGVGVAMHFGSCGAAAVLGVNAAAALCVAVAAAGEA